jgi:hypothetical protein
MAAGPRQCRHRAAAAPIIDAAVLSRTGALAIEIDAGALTIRSARGAQGDRLWTR